jgi:hypothetical protein
MDLAHVVNYVYHHALAQGHAAVCILEDDFFCGDIDSTTATQLRTEVGTYGECHTPFSLMLGCLPVSTGPVHNTHFRVVYMSTGTHAIIHNRSALELLAKTNTGLFDIDIVFNVVTYSMRNKWTRIMYHRPLVYQVFGDTENRRRWGENGSNLHRLIVRSGSVLQRLLLADVALRIKAHGLDNEETAVKGMNAAYASPLTRDPSWRSWYHGQFLVARYLLFGVSSMDDV